MTKSQILECGLPLGNPFPVDGDRRRYDPITAIAGGIGLVGNVVGGVLGKGAASKAGQIQQQAAQQAATGVNAAVGTANSGISGATGTAQQLALTGGQNVVNTAATGAQGVNEATTSANTILDPFTQAGQTSAAQLNKGLGEGGQFNTPFTAANLQMDPGYQFRLQQAALASNRSAAAKGGAVSGAALSDLNNRIQGVASSEYGNAFDRYQTDTTNRYNRLFGTAGLGATTGTTQGGNLTNAAKYNADLTTGAATTNLGAQEFAGSTGLQGATQMGNNTINGATTAGQFLTGGANAAAASTLAGTNALTSGIVGGANAVGGALTLSQILKNPALLPGVTSRSLPPGGVPPGVLNAAMYGGRP